MQHVACHVVRRDSSAIKFDRVDIALILDLFNWPLSDEEVELATSSPREAGHQHHQAGSDLESTGEDKEGKTKEHMMQRH